MKAISLHQPWASFCLLPGPTGMPVKYIETRNWATKYRGTLAIHAAKRPAEKGLGIGPYLVSWATANDLCTYSGGPEAPLPYGAVLGTVELLDCVEMVARSPMPFNNGGPNSSDDLGPEPFLLLDGLSNHLWLWDGKGAADVEDQRPYGLFEPGRFAWVFADAKPFDEPIPAVGRQSMWEWTP